MKNKVKYSKIKIGSSLVVIIILSFLVFVGAVFPSGSYGISIADDGKIILNTGEVNNDDNGLVGLWHLNAENEQAVILENNGTDFLDSSPTSLTFNFGFTATSGRLLVVSLAWDKNSGGVTGVPSDWTRIGTEYVSTSISHDWYYKISDGTETSISQSWTNGEGWVGWVGEYSGVNTLEQSNDSDSGTSAVTSQNTGSITITQKGIAIATLAIDSHSGWDAPHTQTGGFTELDFIDDSVSGLQGQVIASRLLNTPGTYSTTFGTTDTGDQVSAKIANFYLANAFDSSGSGNDGDVIGAIKNTDGKYSAGYEFSGANDRINIGNPPELNFGSSDFSLTAWIRTSDLGSPSASQARIISKQQIGSPFYGYRMMANSATSLASCAIISPGGSPIALSTTNISDGVWHHIACVYDRSTNIKIYIDGVLENTDSTVNTGDIDVSDNFWIGKQEGLGRDYDGTIDDVSAYNKLLTNTEIEYLAKEKGRLVFYN